MPRFPVTSGDQAIKVFEHLGYSVTRQRGSHVRLHHPTDPARKPLAVPRHRELGRGLLRKLLRDASITLEDFSRLLS